MRAAQYVRMSTEHQQYSIENQRAAIAEYAQEHGIEIIKTYADPARSGLDLVHRPGLRQLISSEKNKGRSRSSRSSRLPPRKTFFVTSKSWATTTRSTISSH